MRIDWSEVAEADLDDIYDYIARDVPYYAELFIDQLIEATDNLKDHSCLGRKVPEADYRDDVRELTVQGYRIIYDENQIQKYRICGSCSRSYRPNRAQERQHLSRNNDVQHPLYNGQFSLYIGNVVLGCQVLGAQCLSRFSGLFFRHASSPECAVHL